MDKISIIVPVYNVENYLKRCVQSLENQTYKNLEIVLVDDGSKDESGKICDELAKNDKRIKVYHKQNGGVSSARNLGIEKATGDFITFVDSDDWIGLTMCEKLLEKQKESDFDAVFCGVKIVSDDKEYEIHEFALKDFISSGNLKYFISSERLKNKSNIFISKNHIMASPCRILFKAQKLKAIKFCENVKIEEDLLFLLEFFKQRDIKYAYIPQCYYCYFTRSGSAMNQTHEWIIEDSVNFVNHLSKIGIDEKLVKAKTFLKFSNIFIDALKSANNKDLSQINSWKTKENYKLAKKHMFGFIIKLKNFCVFHNLKSILKLLYKISGK